DELAGQEREVAPEDLLGHAVDAPEVAPVGDRDPQVVDRPAEPVTGTGTVDVDEREGGALHRPMVLVRPADARSRRCPPERGPRETVATRRGRAPRGGHGGTNRWCLGAPNERAATPRRAVSERQRTARRYHWARPVVPLADSTRVHSLP